MFRFYPGVAGPVTNAPAIGAGWAQEAIREPSGSEKLDVSMAEDNALPEPEMMGSRGAKVVSNSFGARAPRVVGSFDHAVLPMPPVCSKFFLCI